MVQFKLPKDFNFKVEILDSGKGRNVKNGNRTSLSILSTCTTTITIV